MSIKRLWAKLFQRSAKFSFNESTIDITHNIYNFAKKGRINIYTGSVPGLRNATANNRSTVLIIEITHPVEKEAMIKFKQYVQGLRKSMGFDDGK